MVLFYVHNLCILTGCCIFAIRAERLEEMKKDCFSVNLIIHLVNVNHSTLSRLV